MEGVAAGTPLPLPPGQGVSLPFEDLRASSAGDFPEVLFSSAKHGWRTPLDLFNALDDGFTFTTDLAAEARNALLPAYLGPDHPDPLRRDALALSWHDLPEGGQGGLRGWLNPPYGRGVGVWVTHALHARALGALIVMLLPARTGTRWFQELLAAGGVEFRFLRGRLRFGGESGEGAGDAAPFDSVIVVLRPLQEGAGRWGRVFA